MNPTGMALNGLKIFIDSSLVDRKQIKFPRSKKKRIQKKWRKNPKYFAEFPKQEAYILNNTMMVCHPVMFAQIQKEINKQEEAHFQKWG